jgi:hypothetical protein
MRKLGTLGKCKHLLRSIFFFGHDIIEYVKRFVKIYEKCQLVKDFGNMRSNIEEMKSIMICDFFYCVVLDITKPLLEMKDGNKYELVTINQYFKWCETRVVDVDLILPKPLHTYYNKNFYTMNIHSFITLH